VTPLRLGSLPHLQDAVAVVGYPIGGDTISVTSGAEHGGLPHGNGSRRSEQQQFCACSAL